MEWPVVHWGAPWHAWLLYLALPGLALAIIGLRARRVNERRLATGERLSPVFSLPPLLAFLACLLLIVALCQPQWGRVEVRDQAKGVDIVFVLDVSRSMLADDVSPTRLIAAKQSIGDLLARLQGDRVGLVTFAGSAFTVCPLTLDYAGFSSALEAAGPEVQPLGGTSLPSALREAIRAFDGQSERQRFLLVISDFEDHVGYLGELATEFGKQGIQVHGLSVGTTDGGLIPLAGGDFVRDGNGMPVRTRTRRDVGESLVAPTGGSLFDLSMGAQVLNDLYADSMMNGDRREISRTRQAMAERYQWPLALALVLLLIEPLMVRKAT